MEQVKVKNESVSFWTFIVILSLSHFRPIMPVMLLPKTCTADCSAGWWTESMKALRYVYLDFHWIFDVHCKGVVTLKGSPLSIDSIVVKYWIQLTQKSLLNNKTFCWLAWEIWVTCWNYFYWTTVMASNSLLSKLVKVNGTVWFDVFIATYLPQWHKSIVCTMRSCCCHVLHGQVLFSLELWSITHCLLFLIRLKPRNGRKLWESWIFTVLKSLR